MRKAVPLRPTGYFLNPHRQYPQSPTRFRPITLCLRLPSHNESKEKVSRNSEHNYDHNYDEDYPILVFARHPSEVDRIGHSNQLHDHNNDRNNQNINGRFNERNHFHERFNERFVPHNPYFHQRFDRDLREFNRYKRFTNDNSCSLLDIENDHTNTYTNDQDYENDHENDRKNDHENHQTNNDGYSRMNMSMDKATDGTTIGATDETMDRTADTSQTLSTQSTTLPTLQSTITRSVTMCALPIRSSKTTHSTLKRTLSSSTLFACELSTRSLDRGPPIPIPSISSTVLPSETELGIAVVHNLNRARNPCSERRGKTVGCRLTGHVG